MTENEVKEFNKTIKETIIPYVKNLPDEKIKAMIYKIEEDNPEIPAGFSAMLYKQVIKVKYDNYVK